MGVVAAGLAVVNCNGDEGASAAAQGTHQIGVTERDPRIALPANAWNKFLVRATLNDPQSQGPIKP